MLVVASDGACGPAAVAYAAVMADDAIIVAEAHVAVQVHDPDSFAAEWLGCFLGLYLLQQVRPTPTVLILALADNTHVTAEAEDHQPSGGSLLDRLWVTYAQGLHAYDTEELYVPAQSSEVPQPAGSPLTLADLKRAAHIRATGCLHQADRGTVPFAMGDVVLLTSGGVPYLRHSVALERQYVGLAPEVRQLDAMVTRDLTSSALWRSLVLEADLSADAINVATWLRAAVAMRLQVAGVFHCPFYSASCPGWGQHLLFHCGKVALAVQAGFRALLLCLGAASGVIRWAATSRAALEITGSAPVVFVLHNDQTFSETQPPPCPGLMCVTWSGVSLAPADSLPPWLHLGARKRAMIEYMETVAQYARFESWDMF